MPAEPGRNEIDILPLLTERRTKISVKGTSMLPFLEEGYELEIVSAAGSDFQPGDLIVFSRDGGLIVHRIIRMNESSFFEMGDNQRTGAWENWQAHMGKAVSIVRNDGRVVDILSESQKRLAKKTVFFQKIRNSRSFLENKARFSGLKKMIGLPFRVLEFMVRKMCLS